MEYCGRNLTDAAAGAAAGATNALCVADVWHNLPGLLCSLHQLHQLHMLHTDIAPANLCFNPRTRRISMIDLGSAIDLDLESRNPWCFSWRDRGPARIEFGSWHQHARLAIDAEPHPLDDVAALLFSLLVTAVVIHHGPLGTSLWATIPPLPEDKPLCKQLQQPRDDACGVLDRVVTNEESHTAAVKHRLIRALATPEASGALRALPVKDRAIFQALFQELECAVASASGFSTFVRDEEGGCMRRLCTSCETATAAKHCATIEESG